MRLPVVDPSQRLAAEIRIVGLNCIARIRRRSSADRSSVERRSIRITACDAARRVDLADVIPIRAQHRVAAVVVLIGRCEVVYTACGSDPNPCRVRQIVPVADPGQRVFGKLGVPWS